MFFWDFLFFTWIVFEYLYIYFFKQADEWMFGRLFSMSYQRETD